MRREGQNGTLQRVRRSPSPRGRAPRGRGERARRPDKAAILDCAFELLSEGGEEGFSVRKVAGRIGVDPMTVLHHFGAKDALLRAIADRALASVRLPKPSDDWRLDLKRIASAYRDLARRYPKIFHLHFRYHATGPADHASSEVVYRALLATGLAPKEAAGLGLAFYSFVLGFSLAEAEGLMLPLNEAEEGELLALDAEACPATRALIPAFKTLKPDHAFNSAVSAFIDGVAARCK